MTEDSRIDKIQKLLAKAERAGTPEEADAFFSKAQELMTLWAIDEAMLATKGKQANDVVTHEQVETNKTYAKQEAYLWTAVGRPNGVAVLMSPPGHQRPYVMLIGFKSDIERLKLLVTSLNVQCATQATRMFRAHVETLRSKPTAMEGYVWRRSFRVGFASRIGTRLEDIKAATVNEADKTSGGTLLPALRSRSQDVLEYTAANFRVGKASNRQKSYDSSGASAGRAAADRADLGQSRMGTGARGALNS